MICMGGSVAIIGAGVSGLTCGVLLAGSGAHTSIFAAETGAQTTSAAAAALWFPYDAEPLDAVITWSMRTYEVLRDLSRDPGTGASMVELHLFTRAGEIPIPPWALSLGARVLDRSDTPACFTNGYALEVPLTDTSRYLDYLRDRFIVAGGRINAGVHLDALHEVGNEYELIVNCAGIGARELVPDPELEPHRGQVAVVPKLATPCAVVCDDLPLMYAIPRANDCVFGGTNDVSFDRDADPAVTAQLVAECSRVLNIPPPPVLATRVGLRPYRRSGVCLHRAKLSDGRSVIHNYGHGGSGFTLSWGCAEEVRALATRAGR